MSTQNIKNKDSIKAEKLEILGNKLKKFNDLSYTTLKDNLLNNKLSVNDRITKQDLALLVEYKSDRDRLGIENEEFINKWVLPNRPDGYLRGFIIAFDTVCRVTPDLVKVAKEHNIFGTDTNQRYQPGYDKQAERLLYIRHFQFAAKR